jgi:hypothetical protein
VTHAGARALLVVVLAAAVAGGQTPPAAPVDFAAIMRGIRPRGFAATPYALAEPAPGGRVWHVSLSGSDAAAGTRAQPLRTIAHAAEMAKAGDVVTIAAGTYDESVLVWNSGEPERPIVFQAEARGTVVLTGGRHTFQPRFWTGGPEDRGQWYVTVRGLVFRRYSDPLSSENAIAAVRASRGWTVEDCLFDEAGRTGVEIRDSEVLITRSTFERNYVNALMAWGPTGRARNAADRSYAPLTGLRITDVVLRGNHTTPDPLTGDRAEYVAKIWGTRGTVIDNVESYENNGPGLWLDTRNTDFVIRNSYFHDNRPVAGEGSRGRGLFIEINWATGLIERNVIVGNSGAGITIANTSGVAVRDNLLAANAHCIAFISARRQESEDGRPVFPLRDVEIRRNRCVGWRAEGALATVGGRFAPPAEMGIAADENMYQPAGDTVLVRWPGIGALRHLADVRSKIGWETRGAVGVIDVPEPFGRR